jgi:hypothetical protein
MDRVRLLALDEHSPLSINAIGADSEDAMRGCHDLDFVSP